LELDSNIAGPPTGTAIGIGLIPAAGGEPQVNHPISDDLLRSAGLDILRATRTWIQYGVVGFALLCIVIGAVEALFGR